MAKLKKRNIIIGVTAIALFYLFGPTPDTPVYETKLPNIPSEPNALEQYIEGHESLHELKPDNEARIVWADTATKEKTPYAVVYLHGFSASQGEGESIHRDYARKYGMNLFLSRLADHGIDTTAAMYHLTADRLWNSAKEAYAIGTQLGDSVILVGTSTGCTLALKLASEYPKIAGLINYSPNISVNDPNAYLLNNPWGLQIAQLSFGGTMRDISNGEAPRQYWYDKYRLEAIVALQELIETTCSTEQFAKIKNPCWVGVYYKDENHQDPVVKVSAAKWMFDRIATPSNKKTWIEFPDAGNHVISNKYISGAYKQVYEATCAFTENTLKIKPINSVTTFSN